jgi:hypothetical protein
MKTTIANHHLSKNLNSHLTTTALVYEQEEEISKTKESNKTR